jgi:hypothetical protein
MGPGPETSRTHTAFLAGGSSKYAGRDKEEGMDFRITRTAMSEVGSTDHSSWADSREIVGVCGTFRLFEGLEDCCQYGRQTVLLLHIYTYCTGQAFRIACSRRQQCADALRMDSSNSRFLTKSCACVSTAFLACIIWYEESATFLFSARLRKIPVFTCHTSL